MESYDQEAAKISPILRGFFKYSLNRIDYCINFDVSELKCDAPMDSIKELPKRIMQLIRWSDIPDRYHEKYGGEDQFYLKSDSVVVNCYWKYVELKKDFPDCKDLKKSYDIIRFEVQFKYPKVSTVLRPVRSGITEAKRTLQKKELEIFRRSLRELANLKINPVTIPDKRINEYFDFKYRLDDLVLSGVTLAADIDVHSHENVSAYLKVLRRIGRIKGYGC